MSLLPSQRLALQGLRGCVGLREHAPIFPLFFPPSPTAVGKSGCLSLPSIMLRVLRGTHDPLFPFLNFYERIRSPVLAVTKEAAFFFSTEPSSLFFTRDTMRPPPVRVLRSLTEALFLRGEDFVLLYRDRLPLFLWSATFFLRTRSFSQVESSWIHLFFSPSHPPSCRPLFEQRVSKSSRCFLQYRSQTDPFRSLS